MKCHACGRELIQREDGLYCIPEWDHTHTFHLTSNKAGCGAFFTKAGWIRQDIIVRLQRRSLT